MIGVIIKGLGGLYTVSDGKNFSEVKAKGVFRKDGIIPMIGDKVRAENGVISEIFPRKNSLVRPPVSNIDKLFIVSSLKNPEPDFLYIDKLTVIAVKFGITPILVFSKSDLSDGSDVDVLNVYSKTPYKVIFTSSVNNIGAKELLSEENPNFNILLDPKCNWALRNLEVFPVEVNRASYEMLLRVPGLGYKSAMRIVKARRLGTLDFPDLKKMGVVLKRAMYFLTCNGRMLYPVKMEEDYITRNLLNTKERLPQGVAGMTYRQLSLFDDVKFGGGLHEKDVYLHG